MVGRLISIFQILGLGGPTWDLEKTKSKYNQESERFKLRVFG
jgi:hypothetical protein